MKILYAYLYCNQGGVCSVIRERISAAEVRHDWFAVFAQDNGGAQQMAQLGVSQAIDSDYIGRAIEMARDEAIDRLHLVDEAEHIPLIRAGFSGELALEIHTSTRRYLDQVTDDIVAQVDSVIVPSDWSRRQIEGRLTDEVNRQKINVLPNIAMTPAAIDSDTTIELDLSRPPLVWIGKLEPGKNWADALRIYARVREKIDCSMTMITGGGLNKDETIRFLAEVEALGITVDWRHTVSRETVSSVYRQAAGAGGALLATTLAESFGLVVLESLIHGLPVVCPELPALQEIVEDGENGMTFPVGDLKRPADILMELFSGRLVFDAEAISSSIPKTCRPGANMLLFEQILVGQNAHEPVPKESSENLPNEGLPE